MKDFFKNLNNEIEKFEWFANLNKSLGDELAEEAYNQIFQHKLNVVGQKIYDYYATIQGVDIPEFMKTRQDLIITKVRCDLQNIVQKGDLDRLYKSAINESEVE
jgi:hypothetical protein